MHYLMQFFLLIKSYLEKNLDLRNFFGLSNFLYQKT